MADFIKVAINASKGIAVHARGNPAKIVAFGAAAAVVFVAAAASYGAYEGTKYISSKIRSMSLKADHPPSTPPTST
jgi:hypothetical protein